MSFFYGYVRDLFVQGDHAAHTRLYYQWFEFLKRLERHINSLQGLTCFPPILRKGTAFFLVVVSLIFFLEYEAPEYFTPNKV